LISRIFLAIVVSLLILGRVQAQVQLERLFPAIVTIGSETVVKAEGKFPTWPVQVVSDRSDVNITASAESGQFKVVVAASATPGVAWIRLHDAKSVSQLVPLLIESTPVQMEVEPNNRIADATAITLPNVVCGRLEKGGDVDAYRFSVVQGQTLVASVVANEILASPMDAVMQLVDLNGNVLLQSDDSRRLDPQLIYQVEQDTDLLLRVFAFPETPNSTISYAGGASFVYGLQVTSGEFVDHVLPLLQIGDDASKAKRFGWNLQETASSLGGTWRPHGPAEATIVIESETAEPAKTDSLPCVFSGHIAAPGEVDRLQFAGTKGSKYLVRVFSQRLGFLVDSVVTVVNVADETKSFVNDDGQRNQYDSTVEFTAPDDAQYEVRISDLVDGYGPRHAYSVVVAEAKPTVELTMPDDHFTLAAGATIELTVSIERQSGFDQPLSVIADQLPAGVTCDAVVSEVKGDTSKTVKLKLVADKTAAPFAGTFRFVAKPTAEPADSPQEGVTASYRLRGLFPISDLWLIVAAP
jgi:hypothetical protein